jgi:hypothetical protein
MAVRKKVCRQLSSGRKLQQRKKVERKAAIGKIASMKDFAWEGCRELVYTDGMQSG